MTCRGRPDPYPGGGSREASQPYELERRANGRPSRVPDPGHQVLQALTRCSEVVDDLRQARLTSCSAQVSASCGGRAPRRRAATTCRRRGRGSGGSTPTRSGFRSRGKSSRATATAAARSRWTSHIRLGPCQTGARFARTERKRPATLPLPSLLRAVARRRPTSSARGACARP